MPLSYGLKIVEQKDCQCSLIFSIDQPLFIGKKMFIACGEHSHSFFKYILYIWQVMLYTLSVEIYPLIAYENKLI